MSPWPAQAQIYRYFTILFLKLLYCTLSRKNCIQIGLRIHIFQMRSLLFGTLHPPPPPPLNSSSSSSTRTPLRM